MRLGLLGLGAGLALLGWLVWRLGPAEIGRDVLLSGWALPQIVAIHMSQLALSALAWRAPLGDVGFWTVFRIRWVREAVNTLLPVAQIGGPVVGVGLLGKAGVPLSRAGAATTMDLMMEAGAQLLVVLLAIGVVAATATDRSWVGWMEGGVGGAVVALAAFVAVQRAGGLRLIEAAADRLRRRFPSMSWLSGLNGLHADLLRLQAQPMVVVRGVGWHMLSWALGGAEVWVVLRLMGHGVQPDAAFVIESLGMMARSVGFAVPGGVGMQEGGLVLAAGLFGVPPEAAIALSVVKRLRELIVGASGGAIWLWPRRRGARPSERRAA
jgi:putative membrane protein